MASTSDDVYDDPDNILANTDDTVEGGVELPAEEQDSLSQSIYNPERSVPGDERGGIDELDSDTGTYGTESGDPDMHNGQLPDKEDEDADRLGDMEPPTSNDGTES